MKKYEFLALVIEKMTKWISRNKFYSILLLANIILSILSFRNYGFKDGVSITGLIIVYSFLSLLLVNSYPKTKKNGNKNKIKLDKATSYQYLKKYEKEYRDRVFQVSLMVLAPSLVLDLLNKPIPKKDLISEPLILFLCIGVVFLITMLDYCLSEILILEKSLKIEPSFLDNNIVYLVKFIIQGIGFFIFVSAIANLVKLLHETFPTL